MASLVTELLCSAEKLGKENIVSKVAILKRKIEDIKLEVQESLKNRYVEFLPKYVQLDKLLHNLSLATSEYEDLCDKVEKEIKPQMTNSVAELHDVLEDLKRIKKQKSIVSDLALLHEHLENAKNSEMQSMYLDAAKYLINFDSLFKNIDTENKSDISIYCACRTEFFVTKEHLIYNLQKKWQKKILVDVASSNKKLCVKLILNKESEDIDVDFLMSLKFLNYLQPVLKDFGKTFLNDICETLLLKTVKIEQKVESDSATLVLKLVNDQCPEPSLAFEQLKNLFQFLYDNLFHLALNDDDQDSVTIMKEFGTMIGEEFCSLIVEKCLKLIVPRQSKQLESFRNEICAAESFHNVLVEMKFLYNNENKLMHFIHNVDTLPVTKMAQDFLSRSRSLMKESLYPVVLVGVDAVHSAADETTHDLNEMIRTKSGLNKYTHAFPQCQISASVQNLVNLLHEVMDEAKTIGSTYSPSLCQVARNICELYCCVVPTMHKEEITNIPQQTAIYHNNCMYIAHCLLTLGAQYSCVLQLGFPMTFVDLVPEIRKLGMEAFLTQMRNQRQLILQLLQEKQVFQNIGIDDGLINKAEKSVRQCLCQLQLLKRVWSEVLPIEVYFKSIGTLFNTCLEEIILNILSTEDIAADSAAQLDSIFNIFIKQGPELFKLSSLDKSDVVHNYIRKWFKFQELQLVLNASMKEIVDRWSSGKGPLASHFTADEVKRLIRALFQNTERRAAALAKIR